MDVTAATLDLTDHQLTNAQGIIAAVKARGWAKKAAYIAVETALVESGMRVLASANVPDSLKYPHDLLSWTSDGLGHDHASCGMFQQQTGTKWAKPGTTTMTSPDGWGPPAVLMDPEKSTALFLNALAHVDWQHLDNWVAAQAVQHSGFPDGSNYKGQDARARRIVDALWNQEEDLNQQEVDKRIQLALRSFVDGKERGGAVNKKDTPVLFGYLKRMRARIETLGNKK